MEERVGHRQAPLTTTQVWPGRALLVATLGGQELCGGCIRTTICMVETAPVVLLLSVESVAMVPVVVAMPLPARTLIATSG